MERRDSLLLGLTLKYALAVNELLLDFVGKDIAINLGADPPGHVTKVKLVLVTNDHLVVREPENESVAHHIPYHAISQVSLAREHIPIGSIFHRESVEAVVQVGYAVGSPT